MKQVVSTMFRLKGTAGGITRVMMNRGRMFDEAGLLARIALFAFDPELGDTVAALRQQGRLSHGVGVVNLFAYYAAHADAPGAARLTPGDYERAAVALTLAHCKRECHSGSEAPAIERFFSPLGKEFLTLSFDEAGGLMQAVVSVQGKTWSFTQMSALHAHWLAELAAEALPCAIIADAPASARSVMRVSGEGVFRILTVHNNHYVSPYAPGAAWRETYSWILENFERADALALLTDAQRKDLEQERGPSEKIHVIPNAFTHFPEPANLPCRDSNLVVAVCRYVKIKGVARMIRAFAKVHRRYPAAKLALYGSGDEEQQLRDQVYRLGLTNNVTIHGYSSDVGSVLRSAAVMLSASSFEGFGLVIAEALSVGTPVVAFDCRYGPAEIITDSEDGYLVDDEAGLAEWTLDLLEDPEHAREMGEAGRRNMKRFSEEAIRGHWLKLFAELETQRGTAKD